MLRTLLASRDSLEFYHNRTDFVKVSVAAADGRVDEGAVFLARMESGVEKRKRHLALAQIGAEVLADVARDARVVEHVVDDLEGVAKRKRVFAHGRFVLFGAVRDRGGHLGARFKEAGGLSFDHFEVALFVDRRVVGVHHLLHFAFGERVGGVRERLHDAQVPRADHHLEGARIKEVSDEDRDAVAPEGVGRGFAAAHGALVDDVVVHEGRRVEEFDRGAEITVKFPFIAERAADEHQEGGAHALAARVDDVLADLAHAGYVGVELLANDGVDRRHVFGDRGEERADERLGVGRTDVLHELFRMVEWVRVQV